jgi:ribonuclease BN (tRNA processing enzyme)
MSDFVALLGTKGGPAIRPGSTMPTASLLCLAGQRVVVDCGLGVTRGLCDQGMALADLSHIVITHLHSDHYLEFGPLLHTAWTAGLCRPVDVWGPEGLGACWQHFLASMAYDISIRIADEGRPDLAQLVRLHRLDADQVVTVGALTLRAMPTEHPPVPCFALRFEGGGKSVVFSADTAPIPQMVEFARGADLLVHEAMLAAALPALVARVGNGDDRLMLHLLRSHTPADQAARIAAQAGVGALALHHLIPSDDPAWTPADWHAAVTPEWPGTFHLGHDGLRIPIWPATGAQA